MSVPGTIRFDFNTAPVLSRLVQMSAALRKHVGRKAMLAALEPTLQEAKARVPVDTGALKRGLLKQARAYARGAVVMGLVGPSRSTRKLRPGKTWKFAGPMPVSRYAHLVENGGPHFAPRPFLRPAYDHTMPQFGSTFGRELMSLLAAMFP